jgi:hypothetical protein
MEGAVRHGRWRAGAGKATRAVAAALVAMGWRRAAARIGQMMMERAPWRNRLFGRVSARGREEGRNTFGLPRRPRGIGFFRSIGRVPRLRRRIECASWCRLCDRTGRERARVFSLCFESRAFCPWRRRPRGGEGSPPPPHPRSRARKSEGASAPPTPQLNHLLSKGLVTITHSLTVAFLLTAARARSLPNIGRRAPTQFFLTLFRLPLLRVRDGAPTARSAGRRGALL